MLHRPSGGETGSRGIKIQGLGGFERLVTLVLVAVTAPLLINLQVSLGDGFLSLSSASRKLRTREGQLRWAGLLEERPEAVSTGKNNIHAVGPVQRSDTVVTLPFIIRLRLTDCCPLCCICNSFS